MHHTQLPHACRPVEITQINKVHNVIPKVMKEFLHVPIEETNVRKVDCFGPVGKISVLHVRVK